MNYLGRHIHNLSALKAPLNEFSQKGKKFVWEDRHQEAFEELKIAVKKAISVAIPDPEKKFTLETDASDTGLGAVLKQDDKIIGFYSTRLTPTQQRYTITEKELLAALWAMEKCKHYLLGKHFDLVTDHKALEALLTKQGKEFGNDRIHRWSIALENFNFTPIYRRGEEMIIPDALSRMHEGKPSTSNDSMPNTEGKELTEKVLRLHEELGHRRAIIRDLRDRDINVKPNQLREILSKCMECKERDNVHMSHRNYVETKEPGELVGLDLMEYKNRYIIVVIDYFTRMVFTKIIRTKEAQKIVLFLEKVNKELPVQKLIVDNGREFANSYMKKWSNENDVEVHYRAPYYHQGTGRVERVIQTLRRALNRTRGTLKSKLGRVTAQYNQTVHRALGMSPRQALCPENVERVQKASERYRKEFNDGTRPGLDLEQKVLIRKEIRSKDDKHFEKHGKVVSKLSPMTYEVLGDDGKVYVRHYSQLKPL